MSDNSQLIVAALLATDPKLATAVDAENSFKEWIILNGARTLKFREYERGDHEAELTDQMKEILRLRADDAQLNELADNYCKIIVDKMVGRLDVIGIKTDTDPGDEWVADLMEQNSFKALQGTTYRASVREGDSYILVDPQTLSWTSEPAYDSFSGMTVLFDGNNDPVWACKLWNESDFSLSEEEDGESFAAGMKVVVYQKDRITFWKGTVGGGELEEDFNQEKEHELPWPIDRIPIIHFVNQADNYTSYGESELRPAFPLQNILNRTLHSMLATSEFTGFPIKYSIGLELNVEGIVPGAVLNMFLKDKEGNRIVEPTEEQVALIEAARVGQFETADMSQFIVQVEQLVQEISQTTQTPIYGINVSGDISGEALKQLEIGLLGKIERFQRENTDAWKNLITLTAEMHKGFNRKVALDIGSPPAISSVQITWKSPELRNHLQEIASLIKERADAPNLFSEDYYRRKIGELRGLLEEEIEQEGKDALSRRASLLESFTSDTGGAIPGV